LNVSQYYDYSKDNEIEIGQMKEGSYCRYAEIFQWCKQHFRGKL